MDKVSFFKEKCRLTNKSLLAELDAAAVEKFIKAKAYITVPDEKPKDVWFLVDGVVCFCCPDKREKEKVDMLISQPGLVSNAILFDYASTFGEKALTGTTILSVPYEKILELLSEYPEMSSMWTRQIQLYALKYWKLRLVCSNMSLAEKMSWFQKVDPFSYAAVTNSQLATFLGVSREAISRTRLSSDTDTSLYDIPGRQSSAKAFKRYYAALSRFER